MTLTKTLTIKLSEADLEMLREMHVDYIRHKGVAVTFPEFIRKRLKREDGA